MILIETNLINLTGNLPVQFLVHQFYRVPALLNPPLRFTGLTLWAYDSRTPLSIIACVHERSFHSQTTGNNEEHLRKIHLVVPCDTERDSKGRGGARDAACALMVLRKNGTRADIVSLRLGLFDVGKSLQGNF